MGLGDIIDLGFFFLIGLCFLILIFQNIYLAFKKRGKHRALSVFISILALIFLLGYKALYSSIRPICS